MATMVTVTGKFSPGAEAVLNWTLSAPLYDTAGKLVYDTAPIPVTLTAGTFSTSLPANDDTTSLPTGTTWTLSGFVDGVAYTGTWTISKTMAPTVDLTTLG